MDSKITFVSAYYNVQNSDTHAHFMTHSLTLLKCPVPLVVFCDKSTTEYIKSIRKNEGLEDLTHIIEMPLKDTYFYKYKEKIDNNRELYWPTRDSRNNTEVHIITINKFWFVLKAIELNIFKTDYAAWIDFRAFKFPSYTIEKLVDIGRNPMPKFTVQVMNCWSKDDYKDLRDFYKIYRWIACGPLVTVENNLGLELLPKFIEKVEEITNLGYGHGEESFYSFMIDDYTDKFTLNVGDYNDILNNYHGLTQNLDYVVWFMNMYMDRKLYKRASILLKDIIERGRYSDYYRNIFMNMMNHIKLETKNQE